MISFTCLKIRLYIKSFFYLLRRRLSCVLVTACGYPDIASRCFVSIIGNSCPTIKIVTLTDYNPYGMDIMMSYRLPGSSKSFESEGIHCAKVRFVNVDILLV